MDNEILKNSFKKIKTAFQKDFYRAKRYNIPLSIFVLKIDEEDFKKFIRKSDYLFHIYDDIYIISTLFCNYEDSLNMVKRLKREYSFNYKKDLKIISFTYHENIPSPNEKLLEKFIGTFNKIK